MTATSWSHLFLLKPLELTIVLPVFEYLFDLEIFDLVLFLLKICMRILKQWGAWVAQSVKRPTSAQVTISRSVSSSPASGSVLTAQSLEPVSDSVSPSLSAPPPFMLCLSLSQK